MLNAAIYARKSTDQAGFAEEQKSVARQIEHARAYAKRKGWGVLDDAVFVDDGISGAEFANRPGFLRLMNALKPRPAFNVLIMSEESRLGREAIETAYALKQMITSGVRVFFYLEDRERTFDSPTDKLLMSVTAFADELEREKARQRTYDAMARKARAGHVVGGRTFGYDNVDVIGSSGSRSHVVYEINQAEAAVVRRIFTMAAAGDGLKTITKQLNADGADAPRPQQGRVRAWAPSSVREILHREMYRGRRVWNKSRKRNSWGQKHQTDRPQGEWLTVECEPLRIIPDAQWEAVHHRLSARREAYARWQRGEAHGAPNGKGVRAHYFLTGFGRCASCGGSIQAVSRSSTKSGRTFQYCCSTYWNRGASICSNGRPVSMPRADTAVHDLLKANVLKPDMIGRVVGRAIEILSAGDGHQASQRRAIETRIERVATELINLSDAAANGGAVPAILAALSRRDVERRELVEQLASLERGHHAPLPPAATMRRQLRQLLDDWSGLMSGDVANARPVLSTLLAGHRIDFEPNTEGGYELVVPLSLEGMLRTIVPQLPRLQDEVASPTGFEPVF